MFIFSLSPLIARKSDKIRSWKSDNFRERKQGKKQRTDSTNEAKKRKSDNFTRGNREKSNIAIAILDK